MTEKEENVYVGNSEAEQGAVAQEMAAGANPQENGSAALGKFKDVDALLKAYGCLQAEFTRRSQRIKELEREVENFRAGNGATAIAEKLRKSAEARKAEEEKFDAFVAEREQAEVQPSAAQEERTETHLSIGKEQPVGTDGEENTTVQTAVSAVAGRGDDGLSSQELYERAMKDEGVRLKIVGEYLASVGRKGAPIVTGGAGALAAPPIKPRSIGEAGNLALKMFKKNGAQA